jgi:hypothetical protein
MTSAYGPDPQSDELVLGDELLLDEQKMAVALQSSAIDAWSTRSPRILIRPAYQEFRPW